VKNFLAPVRIISAGDMTGSLTSSVTNIQCLDNICIQAIYTGTPTGTFSVEGSLDNVNWVALSTAPSPNPTGSAGSSLVQYSNQSIVYIRFKYTASSSTGTLNAYISGKAI
jgi:hypothetical protein